MSVIETSNLLFCLLLVLFATQAIIVPSHLICLFSPQVIFEATVSEDRQGYIALDDILLLNYPCCKYPALSTAYTH